MSGLIVDTQDFVVGCDKFSKCGRKWDPMGASQRSVFASGACCVCHPAYFTIRILWEMCEHIDLPLVVWNRWPICLQREGLLHIA